MSDPVRRLVQEPTRPQHIENALPHPTMSCEECRDELPATTLLFRFGRWICGTCDANDRAFRERLRKELHS